MAEATVSVRERTTLFSNMRYEIFFSCWDEHFALMLLCSACSHKVTARTQERGRASRKKEARDWKRDCSKLVRTKAGR